MHNLNTDSEAEILHKEIVTRLNNIRSLKQEIASERIQLNNLYRKLGSFKKRVFNAEMMSKALDATRESAKKITEEHNNPGHINLSDRIAHFYMRRTGNGARFDYFYEKFSSESTFTDVANEIKLSRERVRQIYRDYFADLFPGFPNGFSRMRHRTAKNLTLKMESSIFAKRVLPLLKSLNLKYDFPNKNRRMININGHHCLFKIVTNARKMTPEAKTHKTHIYVSYKNAVDMDYLIIFQDLSVRQHRIFIIPTNIILTNFKIDQGGYLSLYLPVEKIKYRHKLGYYNRPRINWFDYQNAWSQLSVSKGAEICSR